MLSSSPLYFRKPPPPESSTLGDRCREYPGARTSDTSPSVLLPPPGELPKWDVDVRCDQLEAFGNGGCCVCRKCTPLRTSGEGDDVGSASAGLLDGERRATFSPLVDAASDCCMPSTHARATNDRAGQREKNRAGEGRKERAGTRQQQQQQQRGDVREQWGAKGEEMKPAREWRQRTHAAQVRWLGAAQQRATKACLTACAKVPRLTGIGAQRLFSQASCPRTNSAIALTIGEINRSYCIFCACALRWHADPFLAEVQPRKVTAAPVRLRACTSPPSPHTRRTLPHRNMTQTTRIHTTGHSKSDDRQAAMHANAARLAAHRRQSLCV